MAPTRIRSATSVAAPVSRLFPLVSDYRHARSVIEGLEELRPLGEPETGEGARYAAVLHMGPTVLRASIEIVELVVNRRVTWATSGEEERVLSFEFDSEAGVTVVALTVSYEAPGGLAGLLVRPVVEEGVRRRSRETLARLEQLGLADGRAAPT